MRHGFWAALLGVCLLAPPGRAAERYPRVALELTRGEGTDACIDADELHGAVTERLKREAFTKSQPVELRLKLKLDKLPKRGFAAVVVLEDAKGGEVGRRELVTRATHCSSLDDSLALVVALLVDSPEAQQQVLAQQREPEPPPAGEAPVAPAPVVPAKPRPLTIPEDTPARREPYRVNIAGTLRASAGGIPGVALGGELFLAVKPPRFVELRVRGALFPGDQTILADPRRGGRFALAELHVELCPLEHELSGLRLAGCLGQSVGRVRSQGFGFLRNAATDTVVFSLGAGASALYQVAEPIFILLGAGFSVPIERNTYVSRAPDGSEQQVFRASVLTGGAFGGLGVEL
jgi:hypothetical protein